MCSGSLMHLSSLPFDIHWIRLSRTFMTNPRLFYALLHFFGSAHTALKNLPLLMHHKKIPTQFSIYSEEEASREIKKIEHLKAHFLPFTDPNYPPGLKTISDPPPLLTILGNLKTLHSPNPITLGIVGSRSPTQKGRLFCQKFSYALGQAGYIISSGFSRGIESAAHEGSLLTKTVAVFPGGIDVIFPKEHRSLFQKILKASGAIVSEMPLGLLPKTPHFLRRYRLISGLSKGIIIIEGSSDSAAYITTQMALEQGRDVFAVPGAPYDIHSKRTNALIKEGAMLIDHPQDIHAFYTSFRKENSF